ncbi:MAG: S-layer homology domain-containing protein [Oscillospiraceae bacterium]|nr:S-layer homology domain-containing protein [Oscillospiraceae bacterium]
MTKLGKKRIISLLLCFTMLFSLTSIMAVADDDTAEDASTTDTPHTTIAVDKTEMEVGDTVTVVVSSTEMTASSFACGIQFDLDKLECTSIVGPDEDYPSDFGLTKADTTAKNTWVDATSTSTVDEANANGKVGFVVVGTSDTEYAAGVIYTATFTAIAGGSAEFVLYEQSDLVSGSAYISDSVDTKTVNITVAVTGIALDKTSTSLTVGDTETLTATIFPEDATATVAWESDNESIATVNDGVVTAKAVGTANITATAGNCSATCAVTVNAIDASGATVTVAEGTYTYTGSAIEPKVTVTLDGTVLTAGTDYTVTYTNNINAGTTTATVTFTGNYTGSASATFEIAKADQTLTVTTAKSARYGTTLDLSSLVSGNQGTLTFTLPSVTNGYSLSGSTLTVSSTIGAAVDVTVTAAETTNYNASSEYTITVTSIDKTDVSSAITFDDGSATYTGAEQSYENAAISGYDGELAYSYAAVTGTLGDNGKPLTAGTYTVTATYEDSENMGTAEATFTIEPKEIAASDFDVDTADEDYTGEAVTKTIESALIENTDYTVTYENNTGIGEAAITINGTGNYTGELTYTFNIVGVAVTGVTLDESAVELTVGDTLTLTATVTPENASDPTVTWKSGKASVASVDENGVVTALKAGSAVITATAGSYSATCTVTVTAQEVASTGAALNVETATVAVGGTVPVTVSLVPDDTTESIAETAFESSDSSVAAVDENGVVTGAAAGTATITVTVTTDAGAEYTASCTVTVSDELIAADSESVETVTSTEISIDTQVGDVEQAVEDYLNETYPTMTYTTTDEDGNEVTEEVSGVWEVVDAGSDGTYTVVFIPEDTTTYADAYATVQVSIEKLTPTVDVDYETISASGKTLEDAALTGTATYDGETVEGTLEWDLDETTTVTRGTYYAWTFTPDDTDVYETVTGTVMLWKSSSSGSSSGGSSSSSSTSSISSTSAEGGSVSFSSSSAAAGRTVTVTVTPDEGYVLASLTVTDADGNTIEVTDNGDGTYSFTMPSSEVTVTPVFAEENCPSEPYTDVDTSKWYHSAIDYALNNGYFSGTSATTFEPDASMTRGMFVQVLANIAGIDASEYAGSSFTDVADDAWYAAAVEWAYQNGIVLGVTDDTFAPETTISREQMVVMLYRYAEYLGEDVSVADESAINAFADSASVSDWAVTAMAWAVENGVINGTENGIEPLRNATRAEAAQMFKNFDERT